MVERWTPEQLVAAMIQHGYTMDQLYVIATLDNARCSLPKSKED